MDYIKILTLNYSDEEKINALKEIYKLEVDEIIPFLDVVYELLESTKERSFQELISDNLYSSERNREIIILCINIIEKVGKNYGDVVSPYIPYLIKLLDSDFKEIREKAAEALGNIDSKVAIYAYPKIIKNLDNEIYAKTLAKLILKADNKYTILLNLFENFNNYAIITINELKKYNPKLIYEFVPLIKRVEK
ncbi:HEAT repeat domain-containing protein [Methanocaldococcus indicus]|uniref:HEAT repeat domain-containing protein n=1 Tax=Methanocaldococcus indicus TaxID=213231 RepID=UPI003C6D4F7E